MPSYTQAMAKGGHCQNMITLSSEDDFDCKDGEIPASSYYKRFDLSKVTVPKQIKKVSVTVRICYTLLLDVGSLTFCLLVPWARGCICTNVCVESACNLTEQSRVMWSFASCCNATIFNSY